MNSNRDFLRDYLLPTSSPKPSQLPPIPSLLNNFIKPPVQRKVSTGVPLFVPPQNEQQLNKQMVKEVGDLLAEKLTISEARIVPEIEDVPFNNVRKIKTAVLHIDMRHSSFMSDFIGDEKTIRMYRIFHSVVVKLARFNKGRIKTFAGDRVAVIFDFDDNRTRSRAVETALKIRSWFDNVINPVISKDGGFRIEYGIGIDYGQMFITRVGRFGNNDLVWSGNAMNRASKLADVGSGIFISEEIHKNMSSNLKEFPHMWFTKNDQNNGAYYYSGFIGDTKV